MVLRLFCNGVFTYIGANSSSLITIGNNKYPDLFLTNVTELHGHLARDHHFLQGDTSFRIDPETAIKVLDLKPGVDYAPEYTTVAKWDNVGWTSRYSEADLERLTESSIKDVALLDGKLWAILTNYDTGPFGLDWKHTDEEHLYVVVTEKKSLDEEGIDVFGANLSSRGFYGVGLAHMKRKDCKVAVLGENDRLQ